MFSCILIANRGEIACRIIQSAQKMGMRAVAVYSDADAGARHVRMSDFAVHIGPPAAAQSYLDMDKLIAAAKQSGAEAIHPGYGFLSENPEFAQKCADADIVFIGPNAKSMRAMALKDQAKILMEKAGVPVTPGYHDADQDDAVLLAAAVKIGFPVLIKAVAGGGGRGMRKVERKADFASALSSARREAKAAFGNDNMLIEKFITNPRHIEVQVFGDRHGHFVHFYERDCSVQRRHQKVIEEAPAPGMTADVRAAMCHAAIQAAKTVDYVGAATVEFIVDGAGALDVDAFFFMEMNTRLQVEHPVTEAVTGYDLVQLQFEIAAGGHLPEQDDIALSGHAVEARIYAEQPAEGFLPSTGVLERFYGGAISGVRFDTGVQTGDSVSEFYDPMLAKLIVHRADRANSIADLAAALSGFQTWPVRTNVRFLAQILTHDVFANAAHDTGFIEQNIDQLISGRLDGMQIAHQVALHEIAGFAPLTHDPWGAKNGWRVNGPSVFVRRVQIADDIFETRIAGGAHPKLSINGTSMPVGPPAGELVSVKGKQILFLGGEGYEIALAAMDGHETLTSTQNKILAPMPGKILEVRTKLGAKVKTGDVLVVMEAMKMEHGLKAPCDGVVSIFSAAVDEQVREGAVLAEITP